MQFNHERLIRIREHLNINKAEAARKLNMSAMGYGRYEKGEREPSYQTVCYIAEIFCTTTDYLYNLSDNPNATSITISETEDPILFHLVSSIKKDAELTKRLAEYLQVLKAQNSNDH